MKKPNEFTTFEIVKEPKMLTASERLADLDARIERLSQERESVRQDLIDYLEAEGMESAKVGCHMMTKYVRRGNVQYDKIPQLKGIDLDPYRKEASVYWKTTYINDREEKTGENV